MKISVSELGKKFNNDWIFRNLSFDFFSGETYAITGNNGAGKSTLLQILAGAVVPSKGKINFSINNIEIEADKIYRHISISTPYLELIEEMTAEEFLNFHKNFKPFLSGMSLTDILEIVGLKNALHKQIRYFSSGMKQRLRLAQAFFSQSSCLFLDEPCSNLDNQGFELYNFLINNYGLDRMIIVSSNDPREYNFAKTKLQMDMNIREWKETSV